MNDLDEYGQLIGTMVMGRAGPIIPPPPAIARLPEWPKFLRAFLVKNPRCRGCGRRAETAHHVVPVGVDPRLELFERNLEPTCVACHFVICHAGDWGKYIQDVATAMDLHRFYNSTARSISRTE